MANKTPSPWYDAALSGLSAIPQAVEGVAGLPGAIDSAGRTVAHGLVNANNTAVQMAWDAAHGNPTSWSNAASKVAQRDALVAAKEQQALKGHPVLQYLRNFAEQTLPTPSDVAGAVDTGIRKVSGGRYSGLYQPQTAAGRLSQDVVGTIAAALTGGEGAMIPRALTGLAAGMGGGAARETVHALAPGNPGAEALAQLIGSIGGGVIGAGGNTVRLARATAPQRGEANAANILKESLIDPDEATAKLQQYNGSPIAQHPNFKPTFSQVVGAKDASDLENTVTHLTGDKDLLLQRKQTLAASGAPADAQELPAPMGTRIPADAPKVFATTPAPAEVRDARVQDAKDTGEALVDAAKKAKQDALQQVGQQKSEALLAATDAKPNMQSDAGLTLQQHLDQVHSAMRQREQEAWDEVNNSGVTLPGEQVRNAAQDYINSAPAAHQGALSGAQTALRNINSREWENDQIPISEWQAFRSSVGNTANLAADPDTQRLNRGLADLLGNQLSDASTVTLPDETAKNAWQDAVARTRERNSVFSDTPAGLSVATDANRNLTRPPETAVTTLLSGVGGTQNIRSLRSNPVLANTGTRDVLDKALADHYTGLLTRNGQQPDVSSSDVDALLRNPQAATLASEVPAVGDRLAAIRAEAAKHEDALAQTTQQADAAIADAARSHNLNMRHVAAVNSADAQAEQLQNDFANAYAAGPNKFSNFMDNNKDAVLAAADPEQHDYINQLHSNANTLAAPTGESNVASPTLAAVTSSDPSALVTNDFGEGVTNALKHGATAASLVEAPLSASMLGIHGSMRGLAELGVLGQSGSAAKRLFGNAANYLGGGSKEATLSALGEAMSDPTKAESLLTNPTEAPPISSLWGQAAAPAARAAAYSALPKDSKPDEQPADTVSVRPLADALSDVPDSAEPPSDVAPIGDALRDFSDDRTPHASGGRATFRSGGSVAAKDIEPLVVKLLAAAKKAKKQGTKRTEALLKHDDRAIVAALQVAKRSI